MAMLKIIWKTLCWILLVFLLFIIYWMIQSYFQSKRNTAFYERAYAEAAGEHIKIFQSQWFALTVWKDNRYELVPLTPRLKIDEIQLGHFKRNVYGRLRWILQSRRFSDIPNCMSAGHSESPDQFVIIHDPEISHEVRVRCSDPVNDYAAGQRLEEIFKEFRRLDEIPEPEPWYSMCYMRRHEKVLPIGNDWYTRWRYRLSTGDVFLRRCL